MTSDKCCLLLIAIEVYVIRRVNQVFTTNINKLRVSGSAIPSFKHRSRSILVKFHRLRECESNLLKYYDMKVLIKLNAEINLICRLLETVFTAECELYNRNLAPTEARFDIDRRSQPMLTIFGALKR